jgi:hypothetical protein
MYTPAPQNQVTACNKGALIADDILELDFGKGYEKSCWNSIILGRLLEKIMELRTEAGGWGLPDGPEEYLMGLLQNHLKQSHEAWAKPQPRFSSAHRRLETEAEAWGREKIHLASSASRSRRQAVSPFGLLGQIV